MILALWSAPRSRSTAFLRMMAERGDVTVVHEPFSQVVDFGEVPVGDRVARSERDVVAALRELAMREPVFFKDTTDFRFPGVLADGDFLDEVTHTFCVRHPADAIASHFAVNPGLGVDEIGYGRLWELYEAVVARTGATPVVIDTDDLVRAPDATVRAYCGATGIPFLPHALSWDPGMRADWRRTHRWHERTSATTGFTAPPARYRDHPANNELLAGYLAHQLPFYERLRAVALRIDDAGP